MPTPAHAFHLRSAWRLTADLAEVDAVLADVEGFPRWWPEVYLGVEVLEPGGPDGIGRRVRVLTRGILPYRLRWTGTLVEADRPHGFAIAATGDLVGRGVWRLSQEGSVTTARYDWRVSAEKPLLRRLSPLLAPLFAWNHRWAMARGEAGIRREIARRRSAAAP